jgi:TPR repeat protein
MKAIGFSLACVTLAITACQRVADIPEELERTVAACEGGDMTACEDAAGAFENGIGVEQDTERAAALRKRLLKLAEGYCEDGQVHGCSFLGRAHVEGIGVDIDRNKGMALLKRGCEGGDPLACIYLENLGVPASTQAGIGPERAAPRAELFDIIESKASEAERKLTEDLRRRPK